MSSDGVIEADELKLRLVDLCLSGGSGMPRRKRDFHIILASSTLWMDIGTTYEEPEITDGLRDWLDSVCPGLGLDPVTLRRELVDGSYLLRDDSGMHYTMGPGSPSVRFGDDVGEVEPRRVIEAARAERAARKSAHEDST